MRICKFFFTLCLILFSAVSVFAQAPTLYSWQDTLSNSIGHVIPNATVIILAGTIGGAQAVNATTRPGTPLATIYSDPYGASPINQSTSPLTTAAGNGTFQFWAAAGYYVVQAYGPGINGQITYGVALGNSSGATTAASFTSSSANPATTGVFRMASGDSGPCWRNAANSANLCITKNGSDVINVPTSLSITGSVPSYNGLTLGGQGLTPISAYARYVGRTTAVSLTTLQAVGANDTLFDISIGGGCDGQNNGSQFTVTWTFTDIGNVTVSTSQIGDCQVLGNGSDVTYFTSFLAKAGTNVTYSVAISNTPTYDLRIALKQIGVN